MEGRVNRDAMLGLFNFFSMTGLLSWNKISNQAVRYDGMEIPCYQAGYEGINISVLIKEGRVAHTVVFGLSIVNQNTNDRLDLTSDNHVIPGEKYGVSALMEIVINVHLMMIGEVSYEEYAKRIFKRMFKYPSNLLCQGPMKLGRI